MPPKPDRTSGAKYALQLLQAMVGVGMQLKFNINDVAASTGISAATAKARLLEIRKQTGLDIKTTKVGKSSVEAGAMSSASTANGTSVTTPATATRSGGGRRRRRRRRGRQNYIDHADSATGQEEGKQDDRERLEEGLGGNELEDASGELVIKELERKDRSAIAQEDTDNDTAATPRNPKSAARDKKKATRGASQETKEDASEDDGDQQSDQELREQTLKTQAGRRSAILDKMMETSLPLHATRVRREPPSSVKMSEATSITEGQEIDDAEEIEEDVGKHQEPNDIAIDNEEQQSAEAVSSGPRTDGNRPFVQPLLDVSSMDGQTGYKRKRSATPHATTPTLPPKAPETDGFMPSADLAPIVGGTEAANPAAADAQVKAPSEPPLAKRAKLQTAAGGQERNLISGSAITAGAKSSVTSAMDTVKAGRQGTPGFSVLTEQNIVQSQRMQEPEMVQAVDRDDQTSATKSTPAARKPSRSDNQERRSFFTNPLGWMSYSNDARRD